MKKRNKRLCLFLIVTLIIAMISTGGTAYAAEETAVPINVETFDDFSVDVPGGTDSAEKAIARQEEPEQGLPEEAGGMDGFSPEGATDSAGNMQEGTAIEEEDPTADASGEKTVDNVENAADSKKDESVTGIGDKPATDEEKQLAIGEKEEQITGEEEKPITGEEENPAADDEETPTTETEEKTTSEAEDTLSETEKTTNEAEETTTETEEESTTVEEEDAEAKLTDVTISGTVKASTLTEKAEIKLSEATVLVMDVDKTLKSISGKYALTIQGSHTLTVKNAEGHAISVKNLTSSAPMNISAGRNGLNITDSVNLSGTLSIAAGEKGIYAYDGKITLNCSGQIAAGREALDGGFGVDITGDLTASTSVPGYPCINSGFARDSSFSVAGIVINKGTVHITSESEGLHTYAGDIVLGGNCTIISKSETAVVAGSISGGSWSHKGNILVSGTVDAQGSRGGIIATGSVTITSGPVTASGSLNAISSGKGDLKIIYPLSILEPNNGTITKGTIYGGTTKAANVRIGSAVLPDIAGVNYTTPVRNREDVKIALTGELGYLSGAAPKKIHYQWQISPNGSTGWKDISYAISSFYTPEDSDVGQYIRVSVTADGYTGSVYSGPRQVEKALNTLDPVTPVLQAESPYAAIAITNAKANQEYTIAYSLGSQDWKQAKTPDSDGKLPFSAEKDRTVYVFTRMKETAYAGTGAKTVYKKIYNGYVTSLADLNLDQSTVTTKVGEVTALTVSPLPADFSGWNSSYTVSWFVNGSGVSLYADPACSITLSLHSPIPNKTVYVKGTAQTNYVQVGVEKQVGYSDVRMAFCTFEVADEKGNFILQELKFQDVSMNPGETITVPYKTSPSPANVGTLSFVKTQGPGNLVLTSGGNGTVAISAPASAPVGTYYYEVKVNGASTSVKSAIRITITEPGGHGAVCPSKNFTDIKPIGSVWYHEDVDYVVQKGYMSGVSETLFAPNQSLTRAMVVTILYRMAGQPPVSGSSGFNDVPSGKWYTNAVIWAKNKGIATGYNATTFGPNDPVTREQMVTFLYRYAGNPAATGSVSGFSDAGKIGKWALTAMQWAVGQGIIQGSGGMINPKGEATRAQFAAMVHRYES